MQDRVPRLWGVREFAERLADALREASLPARYRSEDALKWDVAAVVQGFLDEHLRPLGLEYGLWPGEEVEWVGIEPVPAFGARFVPHLAVEVAQKPAVAINLTLVRGGPRSGQKVAAALGEALLYAQVYPAVITLVWRDQRGSGALHLLDREVAWALWHQERIKVVLR